jgi:hypothetical protein
MDDTALLEKLQKELMGYVVELNGLSTHDPARPALDEKIMRNFAEQDKVVRRITGLELI